MKPLPVTVIVLVNRNDSRVQNCLESVSFASEILIVDNNSQVSWKTFSHLPLKITTYPEPITDFSKVRNAALLEASQEWVLFLDSDEVVASPVIPKIAAVLASPTAKAAVVFRSDIFLGKKLLYGEAGHQQLIRMGRKKSIRYQGKVHEVLHVDGELFYSAIEILHYAHGSISEFISDVSKYAQIAASEKKTTQLENFFQLLFYPPLKLLYGLFIQGGIMDGWRGIFYASCMSFHSLLVRMYRYELLTKSK